MQFSQNGMPKSPSILPGHPDFLLLLLWKRLPKIPWCDLTSHIASRNPIVGTQNWRIFSLDLGIKSAKNLEPKNKSPEMVFTRVSKIFHWGTTWIPHSSMTMAIKIPRTSSIVAGLRIHVAEVKELVFFVGKKHRIEWLHLSVLVCNVILNHKEDSLSWHQNPPALPLLSVTSLWTPMFHHDWYHRIDGWWDHLALRRAG